MKIAQKLIATARALVANDKGILVMDESNPTCNKRFAKMGIRQVAGLMSLPNQNAKSVLKVGRMQ